MDDLPDRGPGAPIRPGYGLGKTFAFLSAMLAIGWLAMLAFADRFEDWSFGSDAPAPVMPSREQGPRREPVPDPPRPPVPADLPDAGAAQPLRPVDSPGNWVSDDDYPRMALRKGQQGTLAFRLDIDVTGVPTACVITQSSGHAILDTTACRLLTARARFHPARDAGGTAIPASFRSRFTWRIP